jgi:hypothetical protein
MKCSPGAFVTVRPNFKECHIKWPQSFANILRSIKIAGIAANKSPCFLEDRLTLQGVQMRNNSLYQCNDLALDFFKMRQALKDI